MIPHLLHNKEYFRSYDEKYPPLLIFKILFFVFQAGFHHKYLKLIKMDVSVFAFKLFIHVCTMTNME